MVLAEGAWMAPGANSFDFPPLGGDTRTMVLVVLSMALIAACLLIVTRTFAWGPARTAWVVDPIAREPIGSQDFPSTLARFAVRPAYRPVSVVSSSRSPSTPEPAPHGTTRALASTGSGSRRRRGSQTARRRSGLSRVVSGCRSRSGRDW